MTAGARRLFDEPISETLSTTAGTFSPAPPASSGRPSPHPVLPREIAAIEAERCGPYRDAALIAGSSTGADETNPALRLARWSFGSGIVCWICRLRR